jgi:DNA processing protein
VVLPVEIIPGLVTELLPGAPPRGHQFLARNRIVAGLADATVVVEGRTRSGALATAQRAAEQGREVLACPGSINEPRSRACLDLIRDGATVLTRLEDAVEAAGVLGLRHEEASSTVPDDLSSEASKVLRLLGSTPASVDRLAQASGLGAAQVLTSLADLTTRGLARRTPAGVVRSPGR